MIELDPQKVISDFTELAEKYTKEPDLMTALELDTISVRLMSASGHIFKSTALHSQLHDFRKCVRGGDHVGATEIYQGIKATLASLETEQPTS